MTQSLRMRPIANNEGTDLEDDFGFTMIGEQELKAGEAELRQSIVDDRFGAYQALLNLKAMYQPLLENLKKDSDKDYIKWPNRVPKIEEFEQKVDSFISRWKVDTPPKSIKNKKAG